MQFPITIGLRRFSFLFWLLPCLGVGLSVVLAWRVPIPGEVRLAMFGASLLGLLLPLTHYFFGHQIDAIHLSPDGLLSVAFNDAPGYFLPATLLPGATVHPWLTVLRLRARGRVYPLVLTPEVLNLQEFRQLRVFLRWLGRFNGPGDVSG